MGLVAPSAAASPLPSLMNGPEADVVRSIGQCVAVDHALAKVGQPTLRYVDEAMECDVGDRPSEHRITEELETLVAVRVAVLGTPRPVRQRTIEQFGLLEAVSDPVTQLVEVHRSQSLAFSKT